MHVLYDVENNKDAHARRMLPWLLARTATTSYEYKYPLRFQLDIPVACQLSVLLTYSTVHYVYVLDDREQT